jgi:uncharacterized protein YaaW (UPF0174 family)
MSIATSNFAKETKKLFSLFGSLVKELAKTDIKVKVTSHLQQPTVEDVLKKKIVKHDPIFQALPPGVLAEAARYVGFNPIVSTGSTVFLSSLSQAERESWLDLNRSALEDEFCSVGSWTLGAVKTYEEIVRDLAAKMSIACQPDATVVGIEKAIVAKVWNDAIAMMTPEQVAEIRQEMEQLASKYGKSLEKELTGLAALSAAQLSGFGVYLLGSTVLGAINGALGLGLSFGVFTGLSSLISIVIGPVGWATLGLLTIVKLGAPNYKKILPVVLLIARTRPMIAERELGLGTIRAIIVDSSGQEIANSARLTMTTETLKGTWGFPEMTAEVPLCQLGSATTEQPSLSPTVLRSELLAPRLGFAAGEPTLNEEPETSPELAEKVQRDIDASSKRKSSTKQSHSNRTISKQERTIFRLKNPDLCRMAQSFGLDYLELSTRDQEAVKSMLAEQEKLADIKANGAPQETPKDRTRSAKAYRAALSSKGGIRRQIAAKKAEYRQLLENLEFSDAALGRLCELPSEDYLLFLGQLRRINQGHFNPKCTIAQTSPKVLEQEAGRSGRIYYRCSSGSKTVIELIGTKTTQESDIRALRDGYTG